MKTPDLTTTYLGLSLKNPLVASPGPLTGKIETLERLEAAGIAAVVLPSLFEEQIEGEEVEIARAYEQGTESFAEAITYLPEMEDYHTGPNQYLELVAAAKKTLKVPVLGSLNGTSTGGWTEYARMIQDAGADALELNIYFLATDPKATAADIEARYLELVSAVKKAVRVPVAVKIGPFFSSLPNMATRLFEAGADGLVLFNRFYQPDINLDTLEVGPHLVLSTSDDSRLPLRWIAILRSFLDGSLAATSGVHTGGDVLRLLLAGADVTMMTSALLKYGPGHVRQLLDGLTTWMVEKEYDSVEQLKGSLSQKNSPNPAAFERANYIKTITSYSTDLLV
jgi:dihydroorotate dehydrogenase (fumarate)